MTSPEPPGPMAITRNSMSGCIESEYFDLKSQTVGDTFRIFVARPLFGMRQDCPVVLTTDGNSAFALVSSIQRTLSLGEVPSALVVGVGYPVEGNPFAALFWNAEEVWHWEADFGLKHKDVTASVYLGAGSLETAEGTRRSAVQLAESGAPHLRNRARATIDLCDAKGWPRTAEIIPELAIRLSSHQFESLRVFEEIVPGETHLSASAVLISRGLRRVFDNAPRPEPQQL